MQALALLLACVGLGTAFPTGGGMFPGDVTIYNGNGEAVKALVWPIMVERTWSADDQGNSGSALSEMSGAPRRVRRSLQPLPGAQGNPANGGVDVDLQRRPDGTLVRVDAEQNLYRSQNGRTQVNAHAQYARVYNGYGASRPNYNVGARFSHRW